jgi:hypothetical protein
MSTWSPSEHLVCISDHAGRLVERTRDHEDRPDGLVRTAERVVRRAAALSVHSPGRDAS